MFPRSTLALVLLSGCPEPGSEPPASDGSFEPTARFGAWVEGAEAQGFAAREVACEAGADLPPWLPFLDEAGGWRPEPIPRYDCWVVLDLPGKKNVATLSELAFESAADAAFELPVLLHRSGDGTDPHEIGPSKGLVRAWVDGDRIYWVTTRAAAWEDDWCRAIAAFGEDAPSDGACGR